MNFEKERSLTLFSSEGKIKQCDYALTATINGALSVGACSCDGVALASLKSFSPLIDKKSVFKMQNVCDTIGITYSGLQPDFRIVLSKAVHLAEDYKDVYGRYPFVDVFVTEFSQLIQEYTQRGGIRPFGVMLLLCGPVYSKEGIKPAMYQVDPSGSFSPVKYGAIGKDYPVSLNYIKNRLELLDDNILTCINAIKKNSGIQVKEGDVDVGVFDLKKGKFSVFNQKQIKETFELLNLKKMGISILLS